MKLTLTKPTARRACIFKFVAGYLANSAQRHAARSRRVQRPPPGINEDQTEIELLASGDSILFNDLKASAIEPQ